MSWFLVFYFSSTVFFTVAFLHKSEFFEKLGNAVLHLGVLFHAYHLFELSSRGHLMIANKQIMATILLFLISIIYLFFHKIYQLKFSGLLLIGVPFLLMVFQLSQDVNVTAAKAGQFNAHAFLSVFGFAFLSVSALGAALMVFMDGLLKSRRMDFFYERLPVLDNLEKMSYRAITFGFALLTAAAISGMFHAYAEGISAGSLGLKEYMIFASMFGYVVYFFVRFRIGPLVRVLGVVSILSWLIQLVALFSLSGIHKI
jgi:ABC-type uncharacterized transport system permease subunit